MKAWIVKQWCEPAGMQFEEIATPAPRAKQVRVKVEAAALNFLDTLIIKGQYQFKPPFPFTPGVEVAGTIEAVGEGSRFKPGMRVCGNISTGGYATHALLDDGAVAPIPDNLDFASASALPIVYPTAHLCLKDAGRMQAGATVLVHAGAGGVGSAAIQLAKAHGCTVIATAGGPDKVAVCERLGADLAIDYRAGDFVDEVKQFTNARGVDVVYDPVGGDTYDRSTKVIAWEGRILIIGFTSGRIAGAKTNHLLVKNYAVVGVHWGAYAKHDPERNVIIHDDLLMLYADGKIDPLISEVIGLANAPAALARLGDRGTTGKIVVRPHE